MSLLLLSCLVLFETISSGQFSLLDGGINSPSGEAVPRQVSWTDESFGHDDAFNTRTSRETSRVDMMDSEPRTLDRSDDAVNTRTSRETSRVDMDPGKWTLDRSDDDASGQIIRRKRASDFSSKTTSHRAKGTYDEDDGGPSVTDVRDEKTPEAIRPIVDEDDKIRDRVNKKDEMAPDDGWYDDEDDELRYTEDDEMPGGLWYCPDYYDEYHASPPDGGLAGYREEFFEFGEGEMTPLMV